MSDKCPKLINTVLIGDCPKLLAQASCLLARKGAYLPVLDGPRLTRPDRQAEVIRRNNAMARARPERVAYVGLSSESRDALAPHLAGIETIEVNSVANLSLLRSTSNTELPILHWGPQRIGAGLLKALREKKQIVFDLEESPPQERTRNRELLIVCEDEHEISQVIAANYAYAINGDLFIISTAKDAVIQSKLERFYSLYDDRHESPSSILKELKERLQILSCGAPVEAGKLTIFISDLPFGFAFPEAPSTHLFPYPDLGISLINGLSAEQDETAGISVAALIDPQKAEAPEIDVASKLLADRGMFVRTHRGPRARVHEVTQMIELFPYDLLVIATHCGDAPGWRWTYEFTDSEGIDRRLVVDTAIGVGDPSPGSDDDARLLSVTQYYRFVSLDGVDWNDQEAKKSLYVGRAIIDWSNRLREPGFEPVTKMSIPRVSGSAALQMFDNNLLQLPSSIAGYGAPVILNNACGSWHNLAATFTFGNCRAYIGTLFPVTTHEAKDVAIKLFSKQYGKPLAVALWHAQNETYGSGDRRPYIATGVHPQRLRSRALDAPQLIRKKLAQQLRSIMEDTEGLDSESKQFKAYSDRIDYLIRELNHIENRWMKR